MFRNKWTILVVILVLAAVGLSACAQPTPEVVEKVVEVTVEVEKEVEVEKVVEQTVVVEKEVEKEVVVEVTPEPDAATDVVLNVNLGSEPPTLDPSLGEDTTSVDVMRQLFVGLTRYGYPEPDVLPMLANDWEMSEDGLEYTFNLRDDAQWVKYNPGTGEVEPQRPVTAHDVVYGITRTLNPNTGSGYAYVLYSIKGAEALNSADLGALSEEEAQALLDGVGVEAVDDYTVKITLEQPAGYFPAIAGMWVARPMPQEPIDEKGERWIEPGLIWSNGPMVLVEWNHDDSMVLKKNPYWWGADDVQIDEIDATMVVEASTAYAMYEAGDLDAQNPVPLEMMDFLKTDPVMSEELSIAPRACQYYYGFSNDKAPVDNPLVRRALSAAIDRQSLIDNVTKGNQLPANTFAPSMIFGSAASDPDIAPWALPEDQGGKGYDAAVELAKGWLQEVGYADGSELGPITLMHNTSEGHAKIAQAIAAMWKDVLNVDVAVENQEWKVYLNTISKDTPIEEMPQVWRMGWCADYPDSNNWTKEVFAPDQRNDIRWENDEYQQLVDTAQGASDPQERKALYKQAEKILNDDVAAVIPIYYYTTVNLTKPWLIERTAGEMGGTSWFDWKLDWEAKKAALGIK